PGPFQHLGHDIGTHEAVKLDPALLPVCRHLLGRDFPDGLFDVHSVRHPARTFLATSLQRSLVSRESQPASPEYGKTRSTKPPYRSRRALGRSSHDAVTA